MARVFEIEDRIETGVFAPVERPRLVERLAAAAKYPVALLIAPAGYGKSVVLRQYFRSLSTPHVQFSLRAEHAALLGFLRGFAEALREPAPHAITTLAGAYERSTTSSKRGTELARWMHAHLESFAGVIAIDDLHVADADIEVAAFLSSVIELTKGKIRWILASRSTAGLPVGTWLAYRDADLPIGEDGLRFTIDEASEVARNLGLVSREDELRELLALTDGWPAAMSFALRTSTRSSELGNVSALTREMIYRLLAEQVYAALSDEERGLLEIAVALPAIDVSVLERAGFDRALPMVERLRERTAFIHEEVPGVYQCHELFRDFLRHQSALGGQQAQRKLHQRAAQALEATGDIEHAIGSYVSAASSADVVRLLERHGFELLERAHGDVVARAIESTDDKTRRENATVLALQGALRSVAGKFARAESLFRRALSRSGNDQGLIAMTSLRLASLIGNQGKDATALLQAVGENQNQRAVHRAEALSLIAGQRAVAGDLITAQEAVAQTEVLLPEVESDVARAKILHHIGIAFHHLGGARRAFDALTLAAEIALELNLYGLASRANAVLSNLVLHEEDNVTMQLQYAEAAAAAATKAGDAFALQTALLQMLSARMRQGDVGKSIEIEQRLATVRTSDLAVRYLALFRSIRLAWEGRFGEAHRLVTTCWAQLPFDFDRIFCGSEYALFLAIDGQTKLSARMIREMLTDIASATFTGLFRVRSMAIGKALCALADSINGRVTYGDRVLRSIKASGDSVVELVVRIAGDAMARIRYPSESGADRMRVSLDELTALGYADLSQLLAAVDRALALRQSNTVRSVRLTKSELVVLQYLSAGLVPKEIGERTGRSVFTVRAHIANVIAKLGCRGKSEAIRTAQQLRLI